ncbi:MAG: hypothetical protein U9N81_03820 [Bacillota bacterium]|nr:hypothetical protein [Bacillota bacterium]
MIVSAISIIVLLVIFALLGLIAAGVRNDPKKGGETVIKNVYIYLVLFATLMMTIGGSVGVFMAGADIVAPTPYHQTFEEYKQWGQDKPYSDNEVPEVTKLSEEELKVRYDAMVLAETERQVNRAKNSLIKSLGWIVIPLPVFIYFQRRLTGKDVQS